MKYIQTTYTYTCDDNTNCHEFSIILTKGYWKIECWGASGGDSTQLKGDKKSFPGGKGGYSVGVVNTTYEEKFILTIGGQGTSNYSKKGTFAGGYNGGGGGIIGSEGNPCGSGGGGTDVRRGGNTLDHRIIVAGGGGGAGVGNSYSTWNGGQYGGYGGGIIGGSGGLYEKDIIYVTPTGGTDSHGGKKGCNAESPNQHGEDGSKGKGASISSQQVGSSGGGGGGGYFGGGSSHATGGGGGSGYVGGVMSYRNIKAETIGGDKEFPDPYGGYENGHIGNGFIRITDLNHPIILCTSQTFNNRIVPTTFLAILINFK